MQKVILAAITILIGCAGCTAQDQSLDLTKAESCSALNSPYVYKITENNESFKSVLTSGWYDVEPSHVWSTQAANITLPLPIECQKNNCSLDLIAPSFGIPLALQGSNMKITLNGNVITPAFIETDAMKIALLPACTAHIEISFTEASSPESLGMSADSRILGVALSEMTISSVGN